MSMLITTTQTLRKRAEAALCRCGVDLAPVKNSGLRARSPISGGALFDVRAHTPEQVDDVVASAQQAFLSWRTTPAPVRGALVKEFGTLLAEHRGALAELVAIEVGKIGSEARGEVQEMIDVCDFAVGLSRQLYGRTMPSERRHHRLMETWHPLGVVGIISAFNFPGAVWAWNAAIALTCGDAVVWKPSELTPLTALACTALLNRAISRRSGPDRLAQVLLGGAAVGERLVDSAEVPLISATGSTRLGRAVGPRVAARFGRSLLELGGNNATIVAPSADLDLVVNAVVFAAAGTAGQRCTTLRRLIVHRDIADVVAARLAEVYRRLPLGDPLIDGTVVGPLITGASYTAMRAALERAASNGGEVLAGGTRRLADLAPEAYYIEPALVRMPTQTAVVREETFAPILYLLTYTDFDDALRLHNDVPHGLASGIFTSDQREAERFLAADGSDCGIVNVNIGTSGAEIGGAFGGEKETGGGRESGSDAWRVYMRRATNTINYSGRLALAQNVSFLQPQPNA
jgi:aldehyde dehydrogenase (NAD+)